MECGTLPEAIPSHAIVNDDDNDLSTAEFAQSGCIGEGKGIDIR